MAKPLLVFVHGWSVTSTDTYGELPARLKSEAARAGGPGIDVAHIETPSTVVNQNARHVDLTLRPSLRAVDPRTHRGRPSG